MKSRFRSRGWSFVFIISVLLGVSSHAACLAQESHTQDPTEKWAEYYPLALGNKWEYFVENDGIRESDTITWSVSGIDHDWVPGREVYMVWLSPPPEGDEVYLALEVSEKGIRDVDIPLEDDSQYRLMFPIKQGNEWTGGVDPENEIFKPRSLSILSVGKPCVAAGAEYPDCVIVEEIRQRSNLRIVASYARNVGPVRFDYFRHPPATVDAVPETTGQLTTYTVHRD